MGDVPPDRTTTLRAMTDIHDGSRKHMLSENDFLTVRQSFVPPIPELQIVAGLLAEAADALLVGDQDAARDRLRKSDMPVVHDYASRIMGRTDRDIHRYRVVNGLTATAALPLKAAQRMPGAAVTQAIYRRDGFRCGFCGCRVVLGTARDRMRMLVPGAIRWGSTSKEQHAAFFALTATIDHIKPHARGGSSDLGNLATTCWPCNFGRGNALIEEMGLLDPRSRPLVIDDWGGLDRVLVHGDTTFISKIRSVQKRAVTNNEGIEQIKATARTLSQETWFAGVDSLKAGSSARLLVFLDSCKDLNVEWKLNKVLVANIASKEGLLSVLGIDPTGFVEIPWAIGSYKDEFRAFALTVADAIPGAIVYETAKMWRVKMADRRVSVSELLDASDALKVAFTEFGAALES